MIDLTPHDLAEIHRILQDQIPEEEVLAFGSRVTGSARRFSDLDLALRASGGPAPPGILTALRDAFSESDLSIIVDVADWYDLPAPIRATGILIHPAPR